MFLTEEDKKIKKEIADLVADTFNTRNKIYYDEFVSFIYKNQQTGTGVFRFCVQEIIYPEYKLQVLVYMGMSNDRYSNRVGIIFLDDCNFFLDGFYNQEEVVDKIFELQKKALKLENNLSLTMKS